MACSAAVYRGQVIVFRGAHVDAMLVKAEGIGGEGLVRVVPKPGGVLRDGGVD